MLAETPTPASMLMLRVAEPPSMLPLTPTSMANLQLVTVDAGWRARSPTSLQVSPLMLAPTPCD
eukprot:973662-Rhodomonas_salina.1